MTVFSLPQQIAFPDPLQADKNGLLAVGGDLSPERLVWAYVNGIFPWFSEEDPICWWAPNPRFVLFTDELHISKSLAKCQKRGLFQITFDRDFPAVIKNCAQKKRPGQEGTWITSSMQEAYIRLHRLGIAHSVESRQDGKLVGGLYGLQIGRVFFGESMFSLVANSSKVAFATLVPILRDQGVKIIDCQQETVYLASFGARMIPLKDFLSILESDAQSALPHISNRHWPKIC